MMLLLPASESNLFHFVVVMKRELASGELNSPYLLKFVILWRDASAHAIFGKMLRLNAETEQFTKRTIFSRGCHLCALDSITLIRV